MGAATSSEGSTFSNSEIQSVILKAGSLVALTPGQVVITQGQPEPSLYFILNGELMITRLASDSKTNKEIGRRGRHEVIGEMSFLLNVSPGASVSVPADYTRDVTVVEVKRSRVSQMLQRDPKFAAQVFKLLTMALAHRIALASDDRTGALQCLTWKDETGARAAHPPPEELGTHGPDGGSEALRPERFGLDDPSATLLLQAPCTVVIEEDGAWKDQPCAALLAVFSSALCLELHALNLVSHRVTRFQDVLGCEQVESPQHAGTTVLHVSCRGGALWLSLDASILEYVVDILNTRRLNAAAKAAIDDAQAEPSVRELSAPKEPLRAADVAATYEEVYLKQWVSCDVREEHEPSRASHAAPPEPPDAASSLVDEQLSLQEWTLLMKGAEHFKFSKGQFVIKEGERMRALYQLVAGSATVEMHIKGRPQALVIARKKVGGRLRRAPLPVPLGGAHDGDREWVFRHPVFRHPVLLLLWQAPAADRPLMATGN